MLGVDPPENNLKDYSVSSLLYDHVTEAIDLHCPMKKSYQLIKLANSINNLIFLDIGKKDLFLWNPSIWKVKKLPSSKANFFYRYGFEYNEFHDDYKVVDITQNVRMIVNGKLYWAITTKLFGYYNDWNIIVVDLVDGTWEEMEKPGYGE
ncbi:hypothetical protein CQW23_06121 [Capsicum baccatum]|uniref:F-box associated domain-containing protein n=1 Tax=Capsicum baccatum TaxID=33114 RepID=A0A2G2X2K3_CAPBA|nr:hypothetical protein CQW23_06121 [Capsicum baccatum]